MTGDSQYRRRNSTSMAQLPTNKAQRSGSGTAEMLLPVGFKVMTDGLRLGAVGLSQYKTWLPA